MKTFSSVIGRINDVTKIITGLAMVLMVALVSVQIAIRFIFPHFGLTLSLPWTEELSRYLMVWILFLGASLAARKGALIAMLAFVDMLPAKTAARVRKLSLLVLLGFLTGMIWYGYQWAIFGGSEIAATMNISKIWLYIAMPIGSALAAMNIFSLIVEDEI